MSNPTRTIADSSTYTFSNIGPLTTTFTPPAACLTASYTSGAWLELGLANTTACYPPGLLAGTGNGYYSPGLFCPLSYTPATTLSAWLLPGETGWKCCPRGFSMGAHPVDSCTRILTQTVVVGAEEFTKMWAPPVPIVWQASDTLGLADPATVITPEPTPDAADPPPPPPPAPRQRNTGTIAIATAVPVVLIALVIVAFILFRRRARAPTPMPGLPELGGDDDFVKAPAELAAVDSPPVTVELPTDPAALSELAAVATAELPASFPPAPIVIPPDIPPDTDETDRLRRERDRVVRQRERLMQMQALDEEERMLDERIRGRLGGV